MTLDPKLASQRFRLDKIYRRRAIVNQCTKFLELTDKHALALVKAHDPRFCDIVFEFSRVSGAKWRCFGVARATYFDDKLKQAGVSWS